MHYKRNNKESKTYVQGLRPFGNTLPRGIKGMLRKNGYNYSEIITKWKTLVSKEISNCSFPKSIKMNRGDTHGKLLIAVNRGDEITIEYSKNDIINKINSYFGYQLINEIQIQPFSKKLEKSNKNNILNKFSKSFEIQVNSIKSEKIKKSLSQLLDIIKK